MDLVTSLRSGGLCLGGALAGAGAWCGEPWALPLALVQPALWARSTSRRVATGVALAYQLAATHGAPFGISRYYGTWLGRGVVLWLLGALAVAAGWALLWSPSFSRRRLLLPVALVVIAVPPIGIVGWVHPLTGAGALFPGTGWFGLLAATGVALALSAYVALRWMPLAAALLLGWAAWLDAPPSTLPGWTGIDTHHNFGGAPDPGRVYERQLALVSAAGSHRGSVLLFPESAAGRWTSATANLWADALGRSGDRTILLGSEVPDAEGRSANVLIALHRGTASVAYRQRMPVPLSMWRPWARSGIRAYWFQNPVVLIGGLRAAVLICHEQVLMWPVLHSFACDPQIVVGCANAWWCAGTNIPRIEENSIHAWARLFNRPCVTATNL